MSRLAIAALVFLISGVGELAAQDATRPLEIGVDAGLNLWMPEAGDDVTSILIPIGWGRVAFAVADRAQIETLFQFRRTSSDVGSTTRVTLLPFLTYNFAPISSQGAFVQVGPGLTSTKVDTDTAFDFSSTQLGVGVGVGVRLAPVTENVAIRLAGLLQHWAENDDLVGGNELSVLVGMSFFID